MVRRDCLRHFLIKKVKNKVKMEDRERPGYPGALSAVMRWKLWSVAYRRAPNPVPGD